MGQCSQWTTILTTETDTGSADRGLCWLGASALAGRSEAQIVADSVVPGAVVTQVARRHGCRPQQVHDWRRLARNGELTLPAGADTPMLVPLVAEASPPHASVAASITVDMAEAGVRISGRPGVVELVDVFTALRKASSC